MTPTHLILFLTPLLIGFLSEQNYGEKDTNFDIVIRRRTGFPPGYEADIRSTSVYPCAGYDIRSRISWQKDTLTLAIGGFVRPSPCIPMADRATGSIYLGDIGEGDYVLKILYRSEVDIHEITIRRNELMIEEGSRSFTSVTTE